MPITHYNEYQENIDNLIADAKANPLIDDNQMVRLFVKFSAQVHAYISTGLNLIIEELQKEVDTDGEFKAFLESFVNPENTITVFMAIQVALPIE